MTARQNFLRRRLAGLPDALAAQLGDSLKLNTQVIKLLQIKDGWRVAASSGEIEFGAVIYCGTAHRLAELKFESQSPLNLLTFSEISCPPVASVVLGFHREDVTHPCAGFGMLIPRSQASNSRHDFFFGAVSKSRAERTRLLTSYVGGVRQPELAALPAEKLSNLCWRICACCWACAANRRLGTRIFGRRRFRNTMSATENTASCWMKSRRTIPIYFLPEVFATAFRWVIRLSRA